MHGSNTQHKPDYLVIFDAHNHLFADWHASGGAAGAAVQNFVQRIMLVHQKLQPDAVLVAFDHHEKTFRHKIDPAYKAGRPSVDPDLKRQIRLAYQLLMYAGVPCLQAPGYEADDVIATLICQHTPDCGRFTICSNDKDLRQLLAANKVNIARKIRQNGAGEHAHPEIEWLTANLLEEQTGIKPEQYADYLCLCGDPADNIQGAPGIGPSRARKLLQQYGRIEDIQLDELTDFMRQGIEALQERLDEVRQLVRLRTDLQLTWHPLDADRQAFWHLSKALQLQWEHCSPDAFWKNRAVYGEVYIPKATCPYCPASSYTDIILTGKGAVLRRCDGCGRDVDSYTNLSMEYFYGPEAGHSGLRPGH